jgi:xylan 1,4-beta-xylosidase
LVWDLTHPTGGKIANHVYFHEPRPAPDKGQVAVKLTGVPPGKYTRQTWRVGYHENDPYTAWLEMGRPGALTRAQTAQLQAASRGEPAADEPVAIGVDGTFRASLPFQENEMVQVKLAPIHGN